MTSLGENCQLCHKAKFKYTCPKCNVLYCSLNCYKSQSHLKCSEEFYKSCIEEEITSRAAGRAGRNGTPSHANADDMRKMYEILKRIREADAGLEPQDLHDFLDDQMDSDDEPNEELGDDDEAEADEEDLTNRLQGVNLDDAEEVWQHLNAEEREEFLRLVKDGNIMNLVPKFTPWWSMEKKPTNEPKIVELSDNGSDAQHKNQPEDNTCQMPKIYDKIPNYSALCSKEPSPSVRYNLLNILSAYACVVRFFAGDHLTSPSEAISQLVDLCSHLKHGTNFEETDDAIISVEMESLARAQMGAQPIQLVESREQLKSDAKQLIMKRTHQLAALSDILKLLKLAKAKAKAAPQEEENLQKLFALCSGTVQVDRTRILQMMKKIEFMLAYVNRDEE